MYDYPPIPMVINEVKKYKIKNSYKKLQLSFLMFTHVKNKDKE